MNVEALEYYANLGGEREREEKRREERKIKMNMF